MIAVKEEKGFVIQRICLKESEKNFLSGEFIAFFGGTIECATCCTVVYLHLENFLYKSTAEVHPSGIKR